MQFRTQVIAGCEVQLFLVRRDMKFVALISGGKDSIFNILSCINNGHELVALGNLYPNEVDVHEIDSFMFQTVGHSIVEYYRDCLRVPLYRRKIIGGSKNQDVEYWPTQKDEIEDLFLLLSEIVKRHPDIEAVSSGAILSQYQRTRVENVCSRLSLTSLCYLWQRDQLQLMKEMCQSGLDARIIKVAAIGLDSKHLGRSIQELFPYLVKLNQLYDVHICGEGGEFETVVLDLPIFKSRLTITDQETVRNSGEDTSYLKIKVLLQEKDKLDTFSIPKVPLLDETFSDIAEKVVSMGNNFYENESTTIDKTSQRQEDFVVQENVKDIPAGIYISNLTSSCATVKKQVEDVFSKLERILHIKKLQFSQIQHVTLLLSDMKNFSEVNTTYERYFQDQFLPPSRVCVETGLSKNNFVQISCKALNSTDKQGLHVRSRSYWAPQNIGPYSQAIVCKHPKYRLASLAGQIPLVPVTMNMLPLETYSDLVQSAVLSLQHIVRIMTLVRTSGFGPVICFLVNQQDIDVVARVWNELASEEERNHLIIVKITKLPRNARVEWSGFSFQNIVDMYEDFDDSISQNQPFLPSNHIEKSCPINVGNSTLFISLYLTNDANTAKGLIEQYDSSKIFVQIYASTSAIGQLGVNAEIIPVSQLWSCDRQEFQIAVVVTYQP